MAACCSAALSVSRLVLWCQRASSCAAEPWIYLDPLWRACCLGAQDFEQGSGVSPQDGQEVTFQYTAYNESGSRIDSSYRQGRPASTRLGINGLIPGAGTTLQDTGVCPVFNVRGQSHHILQKCPVPWRPFREPVCAKLPNQKQALHGEGWFFSEAGC